MIRFIMSILLGFLPDVLYYFLMIKNIKNIKNRRILFFILLFLSYILCIMLIKHQFYLYIISDLIMFLILKFLYNSKITDFFLIVVLEMYIMLVSLLCFKFIGDYFLAYIINRIIIFIPLIFKKKLNQIYVKYNILWNRHNKSKELKSITLRNISIVLFNMLIVLIYFILVYILSIKG